MKMLKDFFGYIAAKAESILRVLVFASAVVTLFFAAVVFSGYFNLEKTVKLICGEDVSACSVNMDVIHMAAELGRLDLVSAMLTALGVLLIFVAIATFNYSKSNAENTARETANTWLAANAQRLIRKELKLMQDIDNDDVGNPDPIAAPTEEDTP